MKFSINGFIHNEVIRFVEAEGSTSSRMDTPISTESLFRGKAITNLICMVFN
jgi:hypothetical protein